MRDVALTITTDQIKGWGIVGCVIILIISALVIKLAKSIVGRVVWTVIAIGLLGLIWVQRTSVENSIKQCDPRVLGVHLEISDATTRAHCMQIVNNPSS